MAGFAKPTKPIYVTFCSKASMTHRLPLLDEEEQVSFNAVVGAVINKCERDLNSCLEFNNISLLKRRNLMRAFYESKIRLGRLLELSRWIRNSRKSINVLKQSNGINEYCQKSAKFLRSIKFEPIAERKVSAKLNYFEIKEKIFDPRSVLISMLQKRIPTGITNITLDKNIVKCFSQSNYEYGLKIKSNSKLKLVYFKLFFDFPYDNLKRFISLLSSTIDQSHNVFYDLHKLISKFKSIRTLLNVCTEIKKYEKTFGHIIKRRNNSAIVQFGSNSDYCIEYKIDAKDFCVQIFSLSMLEQRDRNEKKLFSWEITDESSISEVLSEMRDAAIYSRLYTLQQRVEHAFIVAGFPSFSCNIERDEIVIRLLGFLFCKVYLNRHDCEPDAIIYNDLGVTAKEFVHALTCDKCERVNISHSLYLVSVSRSLLHTVSNGLVDALYSEGPVKSCVQRSLRFSFAPSFFIRMTDSTGKMMIDIISEEDKTITSTHDIIKLNTLSFRNETRSNYLDSAIKSSKAACVILQMQKVLSRHGINAEAENNKIHFEVPNFECVEFKCKTSSVWSLNFVKPSNSVDCSTVCIHGNKLTANFCGFILHLVNNVSKMFSIGQEISTTCDIYDMVDIIHKENKLSFAYRPKSNHITDFPIVDVSFPSLRFDKRIRGVDHFTVISYSFPKIHQNFSSITPLKTMAESQVSSTHRYPTVNTLVFFCSFSHFMFRVFALSPNWTLAYSTSNNYTVIFKRQYPFSIQNAQHSFVIVRTLLNKIKDIIIPLSAAGETRVKGKGVATQINCKNLSMFKESVESYFFDKNILMILGFNKYRFDESRCVTEFEAVNLSGTFFKPTISASGMSFNINGDYASIIQEYMSAVHTRRDMRQLVIIVIASFSICSAAGRDILNLFSTLNVDLLKILPTVNYNTNRCLSMVLFFDNFGIRIIIKPHRNTYIVDAFDNNVKIPEINDFNSLASYCLQFTM